MTLKVRPEALKVGGMLEFSEMGIAILDGGCVLSQVELAILKALAGFADRCREAEMEVPGYRARRITADDAFIVALEAVRRG
jgi:hypothetical protein